MAVTRSIRAPGFYRSLDDFNRFLEPVKKTKTIRASKKLFPVERLISKRTNKGKNTEYLVKWKDYSAYECRWEDESHLTPDLISSFDRPPIVGSRQQEHVDILQHHLSVKLKSSSRIPHSFSFFHDVFRGFFFDKGRKSRDGKALMLEKKDLNHLDFPAGWDESLDKNGDGTAIKFPIRFQLHLSWSPKMRAFKDGNLVLKPRMPVEKLSVQFVARPFSTTREHVNI